MKIFNSLTNKQEEFTPIVEGEVGIYSCGPTVYNNLHIGNLSAFIYADVLRRAFNINGFDTNHVMNITDIDDKTIRDSQFKFPDKDSHVSLKKLTDKYTAVFMKDMELVGNNIDDVQFISAVESIPEMILMIQKLLDEDIAYIADDGVYFSITKYYQSGKKYGVLQKVATQQSKARISNDEYDKASAGDFALWKRAVEGEPSWPVTFTEDLMETDMPGRPGWHIECSAMSQKTLGVPFDVHTGGIDLKFPHHENEIAQSCGAGAEKLANYFFHNNHVLIDGRKMSKSLGNVYTLRDLDNKGFSTSAFRLLVLESHYHSESNFSWEILASASNRLKNWLNISETIWQLPESDNLELVEVIKNTLGDNLNTPLVLKEIDSYFEKITNSKLSPNKKVLDFIQESIGITLATEDIDKETKNLLAKRMTARTEKKWAESDKIRDELLAKDILVRDESTGQIWYRK